MNCVKYRFRTSKKQKIKQIYRHSSGQWIDVIEVGLNL